jgi:hypothetical protein
MQLTRVVRTVRVYSAPLSPVVAVLVGAFVFGLLCFIAGIYPGVKEGTPPNHPDLDFLKNRPTNAAALANETAAAVRWAMAATLLVLGLLAVAVVCFGAWLSKNSNHLRTIPLVVATILLGLFLPAYGIASSDHKFEFGGQLLNQLLTVLWARTGHSASVQSAIKILNIAAIVVILAGVVTASLLLQLPKLKGHHARERLCYFADRFLWLNRLLYAGAVLLVAGVLEVASIAAWPIAPFQEVADDSSREQRVVASGLVISIAPARATVPEDSTKRQTIQAVRRFVGSLIVVAGVSFYLPARFILFQRIRKAATQAFPGLSIEERTTKLADVGIDLGQGQRWIQTLAATSPIVAGAATGLQWVLK